MIDDKFIISFEIHFFLTIFFFDTTILIISDKLFRKTEISGNLKFVEENIEKLYSTCIYYIRASFLFFSGIFFL